MRILINQLLLLKLFVRYKQESAVNLESWEIALVTNKNIFVLK